MKVLDEKFRSDNSESIRYSSKALIFYYHNSELRFLQLCRSSHWLMRIHVILRIRDCLTERAPQFIKQPPLLWIHLQAKE